MSKIKKYIEDEIAIVINNELLNKVDSNISTISNIKDARKMFFVKTYDRNYINKALTDLKNQDEKAFKRLLSFCDIKKEVIIATGIEIDKNLFQFIAFLSDLKRKIKKL